VYYDIAQVRKTLSAYPIPGLDDRTLLNAAHIRPTWTFACVGAGMALREVHAQQPPLERVCTGEDGGEL
jgi:hypothetical protein